MQKRQRKVRRQAGSRPFPKRQCAGRLRSQWSCSHSKTVLGIPARHQKETCLFVNLPPKSVLAKVLAELAAGLDKVRSSRSLEEEFGVDRRTPMFSTAADQEGQRLNAPCPGAAHSAQRTRHGCPGVFSVAHADAHVGRSDDCSPRNFGAGSVAQRSTSLMTVVTSELCEESS